MTPDLAAFINARLGEEAAAAMEADKTSGGRWFPADTGIVADGLNLPDALHMARWSPSRVLREAEALRAIVAEHWHILTANTGGAGFGCAICAEDRDYGILPDGWCMVLRHLGGIWRDHPGYDPGWTPDPDQPPEVYTREAFAGLVGRQSPVVVTDLAGTPIDGANAKVISADPDGLTVTVTLPDWMSALAPGDIAPGFSRPAWWRHPIAWWRWKPMPVVPVPDVTARSFSFRTAEARGTNPRVGERPFPGIDGEQRRT